ncbi:hypothetical protein NP493_850g01003 [Ridgeia piscesae]|uniref:Uncharacterized protein n=1 Tax=Ridgeia piscesae TaxID=27915 RepID=A0AAD9NMH0_RIDPI|nr:hypothetical protein NP493_850g01003 [Ridgeia piscesae]
MNTLNGSDHNFCLLRASGWISTIGQYPLCSLVRLQAGTRLFWFPG